MNTNQTTMTITAAQVLQLLAKANKLGASPIVGEREEGYIISFWYDFYGTGGETETVFISVENENVMKYGNATYNFNTMMHILDKKLEEKEQEKIKAEKCKELIARLTDEEKELLGIK
jgi:hypothetical protein